MRTTAPHLGEFEYTVLLAVLHLKHQAYAVPVRAMIETRTGRAVARGALYTALERSRPRAASAPRNAIPATPAADGRAATSR